MSKLLSKLSRLFRQLPFRLNHRESDELQEYYLKNEDSGDMPPLVIRQLPSGYSIVDEDNYSEAFAIPSTAVDKLLNFSREIGQYGFSRSNPLFQLEGPPDLFENLASGKWQLMNSDGKLLGTVVDSETNKVVRQARFRPNKSMKTVAIAGAAFQVMSIVTAQYYLAQIIDQLSSLQTLLEESVNRQQMNVLGRIRGSQRRLGELFQMIEAQSCTHSEADLRLALVEQDITNCIEECRCNLQYFISQQTQPNEFEQLRPKDRGNLYHTDFSRCYRDLFIFGAAIDLYATYHNVYALNKITNNEHNEGIYSSIQISKNKLKELEQQANEYLDYFQQLRLTAEQFDESTIHLRNLYINLNQKKNKKGFVDRLNVFDSPEIKGLIEPDNSVQTIRALIQLDDNGDYTIRTQIVNDCNQSAVNA